MPSYNSKNLRFNVAFLHDYNNHHDEIEWKEILERWKEKKKMLLKCHTLQLRFNLSNKPTITNYCDSTTRCFPLGFCWFYQTLVESTVFSPLMLRCILL